MNKKRRRKKKAAQVHNTSMKFAVFRCNKWSKTYGNSFNRKKKKKKSNLKW